MDVEGQQPVVRYATTVRPAAARDDWRMIVELRSVPDCPNLGATRSTLVACLAEAGVTVPVIERVGDYRSPSVLINGIDVTGADPSGPPACVLQPPTAAQIRAALNSASPAATS
jgi:hypothetical protein